jgi:membrane-bound serine protease (ClpP class)
MIGEIGVALSDLAPSGRVFIRGEYWEAEAENLLPAGTRVQVTAVYGLKLRVQPVTREQNPAQKMEMEQ